jgi:hypothetical protein
MSASCPRVPDKEGPPVGDTETGEDDSDGELIAGELAGETEGTRATNITSHTD